MTRKTPSCYLVRLVKPAATRQADALSQCVWRVSHATSWCCFCIIVCHALEQLTYEIEVEAAQSLYSKAAPGHPALFVDAVSSFFPLYGEEGYVRGESQ